jgi:hydrogenase nickel incorporation protein HypA/HybF
MHELSIAQEIVETVRRYLPPGEARPVKSVKLEVGDLERITSDSLRFCFEVTSQGTSAEGAELKIEQVSGEGVRVVEFDFGE